MLARQFGQGFDNGVRRQLPAVDGNGIARLKAHFDNFRFVGGLFHGHAAVMADFVRRVAGIFQFAALKRSVQHVGVHAVALGLFGNEDAVLFGKGGQGRAGHEIPLAPGRDDPDFRGQGLGGKFEAHLIIALARGAVRDGVGAFLAGDVDKGLGDAGARDRGAQHVAVFVAGRAAHHGEDEVAGHFFAQVNHIGFGSAGFQRFFLHAGKILGLAQVGGAGDDLAMVGFNEPFENNGCIQPAGIGEHDFFDVLHARAPLWIRGSSIAQKRPGRKSRHRARELRGGIAVRPCRP